MITLGIETSCDETALALIETRGDFVSNDFECRVIASLVHSQAELHSAYGGVFPTLAKREHGKNLVPLLQKILSEYEAEQKHHSSALSVSVKNDASVPQNEPYREADFEGVLESFKAELETKDPDLFGSINAASFLKIIPSIDRIAVTEGPGLEPTLWVGINFAKFLAKLWNVPLIPVNHMEGHIVASLLRSDIAHGDWQKLNDLPLPALALLISGGHTELVKINKLGDYELVGMTRDDAVGEAFDKSARLLGLKYPGGPQLAVLADQARNEDVKSLIKLPRPMIGSKDLNFSFSGLKTAVLYAIRDQMKKSNLESVETLDESFKKGLAREFEDAVTETLISKLHQAVELIGVRSVIIGGGVSANKMLRKSFVNLEKEYDIPFYLPTSHTSGDNALMIALACAIDSGLHKERELKAEGTKRLAISKYSK